VLNIAFYLEKSKVKISRRQKTEKSHVIAACAVAYFTVKACRDSATERRRHVMWAVTGALGVVILSCFTLFVFSPRSSLLASTHLWSTVILRLRRFHQIHSSMFLCTGVTDACTAGGDRTYTRDLARKKHVTLTPSERRRFARGRSGGQYKVHLSD